MKKKSMIQTVKVRASGVLKIKRKVSPDRIAIHVVGKAMNRCLLLQSNLPILCRSVSGMPERLALNASIFAEK